MTWMARLLLCLGLVSAGVGAQAGAIYRYVSQPLVNSCSFDGVFLTSCSSDTATTRRLSASLELASALPANSAIDLVNDPSLVLTLADGSNLLRSGGQVSTTARVITDANGAITSWALELLDLTAGKHLISSPSIDRAYTLVPGSVPNPGASFSYRETIGNDPGTWTFETTIDNRLGFGSATRTLYQGPFDAGRDTVDGAAGAARSAGLASANLSGTQAAQARVQAQGPVVGAWSSSTYGSGAARGIAFRTYLNTSNAAQSFKVNAAFDGRWLAAPSALPLGTIKVGAAIHVFDTEAFAARLAPVSNSAQFLLGAPPAASASDPQAGFTQLRSLFPQGLLGSGQTIVNPTLGPASASVATSDFVTVGPQKKFTVMYDVATSSAPQQVGERAGTGVANFLNTLAPAAVHFTGLAGEAVVGLVIADAAPAPAAAPSAIALTPASSTHAAGQSASVVATVSSDSNGSPVAASPVEFYVTAGPDIGKTGVAITDAQGRATFSYVGDNDIGKDVLQARIASLASPSVEHTWTAARCPKNQAFWVRFTGLWPVQTLSIGGRDYDQATLLRLLKLAPPNASVALFQQVTDTRLNAALGGDTSRLAIHLAAADKLLANFNSAQPAQNQVDLKTSLEMLALAARMAVYNLGVVSPTCMG